ncbi:NlpC/P60 family protein [Aldersonia sp. NBC_00410]|uniref:C40 family peptidase n=1 Tax=Aldersonia sp. NBC_00410 TaxID=2975954 RepID=UPI00224DA117|nr:C40 family peptidase [Aldersonia sp. NBC_00410]MCX5044474.1 NlpC/P60 family protein [Aldersonia sp. NBC_00410]
MIDPAVLAAPITDLLGSFGSGVLPSGGPADALRLSSAAIDAVHAIGRDAVADLDAGWRGRAAGTAVSKAQAVQDSSVQISDRGNSIADVVGAASADVNAGLVELEGILQSFISIAVAAAPTLVTPAGLAMIVTAAIEHLNRALAVVAKVRAQLSTHTARMTELTAPEVPTAPASVGTPTHAASAAPSQVSDAASKVASGLSGGGSGASGMSSVFSSPSHGRSRSAALQRGRDSEQVGAGAGPGEHKLAGRGVEITLPDGSTAVAPNEEAATAVRAALSQQGVPYVWGGNSPGEGLDCSGLTKYAYGEAGVDLPRLAQEQQVGHLQISEDNLMPGDLAVWDGHVAMVIGNGQLVEAGDPVSTGPIRTENIGMQFYGFYRPTASAGEA